MLSPAIQKYYDYLKNEIYKKVDLLEKEQENLLILKEQLEEIMKFVTERGLLCFLLNKKDSMSESEGSTKTDQHKPNACVSQKQAESCEKHDKGTDVENYHKFCEDLHNIIFNRYTDPYTIVKIKNFIDYLNVELSYQEKCLERESRFVRGLGVETEENEGDDEGECQEKVEKVRKVDFYSSESTTVLREGLNNFLANLDYEFSQPEFHFSTTVYCEGDYCKNVMVEYFVKKEG